MKTYKRLVKSEYLKYTQITYVYSAMDNNNINIYE